ncbi:response regulator transcription factor [bacterium]|nr:response regulator transcription factor [bacterium]
MYKHRATMTDRRYKILKLIAKGYNNKQIARKMKMSLSCLKTQKWRLYCYLGEIHTAIDAVYMGLQMGLLQMSELCEPMREEILYNENEKQMHRTIKTERSNNRNIQTNTKIIPFPAKRVRAI